MGIRAEMGIWMRVGIGIRIGIGIRTLKVFLKVYYKIVGYEFESPVCNAAMITKAGNCKPSY